MASKTTSTEVAELRFWGNVTRWSVWPVDHISSPSPVMTAMFTSFEVGWKRGKNGLPRHGRSREIDDRSSAPHMGAGDGWLHASGGGTHDGELRATRQLRIRALSATGRVAEAASY